MIYCETMFKGKGIGSYNRALKIVEHLGRYLAQPVHEITQQVINDLKITRLKKVKPAICRTQLAFMSRFYGIAKHGLLIDRTGRGINRQRAHRQIEILIRSGQHIGELDIG